MKGLPMTYNRDMQEDKEPLFEAADQLRGSLEMARVVVETAKLHPRRPRGRGGGELGGRDRSGRGAGARRHAVPPGAPDRRTAWCSKASRSGKKPADWTRRRAAAVRAGVHAAISRALLDPREGMKSREIPGGTGPDAVAAALARARQRLGEMSV